MLRLDLRGKGRGWCCSRRSFSTSRPLDRGTHEDGPDSGRAASSSGAWVAGGRRRLRSESPRRWRSFRFRASRRDRHGSAGDDMPSACPAAGCAVETGVQRGERERDVAARKHARQNMVRPDARTGPRWRAAIRARCRAEEPTGWRTRGRISSGKACTSDARWMPPAAARAVGEEDVEAANAGPREKSSHLRP